MAKLWHKQHQDGYLSNNSRTFKLVRGAGQQKPMLRVRFPDSWIQMKLHELHFRIGQHRLVYQMAGLTEVTSNRYFKIFIAHTNIVLQN